MSPTSFSDLSEQFAAVASFWWVWLPVLLVALFYNLWLAYVRAKYKANIKWSLLEIRIPREIKKTPKAMEQILAGLYGLRNKAANIIEKYVDGEVTMWFSLEMVSFSGDVHFYIRTPAKHRNIVEALFYAHYPDLDIAEVSDYMHLLPRTLSEVHAQGYEIWGTELKLAKDDAYPIRTYEDFHTTVEEEQLDPVSALLEVLGKMNRGEKVLLQILARPADHAWVEKGKALLEDIKKKTSIRVKTRTNQEGETETGEGPIARTPGETDLLKAIDRNLSKPGFEVIIRYIYLAPQEVYSHNTARRGIYSCFNQYSAVNMNNFRHNPKVRTETWWVEPPYIFPKPRRAAKKRRILKNYRGRYMPEETFSAKIMTSELFDWNVKSRTFVLNIEELATVWHLPSHLVLTAPFIQRVESRKIGPPAGLPIFGSLGEHTPWDTKS